MNKFIFSFLSLSILFATACSKENNEKADILDRPHSNSKIELSAEEYISIAYDNPMEISDADIFKILDNFIKLEYVLPKGQTKSVVGISTLKRSDSYHLSDKISISSTKSSNSQADDIDCTIAEFELEANGQKYKSIISTDERYPKVLAFMKVNENDESCSMLPDCEYSNKQESSQSILNLTFEALYNHLHEIEVIKKTLRDDTLLKISRKLHKPVSNISFSEIKNSIFISGDNIAVTKSYAINFPTDQILSGCWPLVEVAWGGNNSITYNYMPYYWGTNRVWARSAVTAILHTLSVIKPNMTIPAMTYEGHGYKTAMSVDWDLLTQTEHFLETDSEVKKEMGARLYRLINDEIGLKYKGTSSNGYKMTNADSKYTNKNFLTVLRKHINCNNITAYNLTTILNSLGRARPVFMDSHEIWGDRLVIDGYFKTRSTSGINSTYLHLLFANNSGNKSTHTGYYLVNANSSLDIQYNSSCVSYSKNFKIIPECRPK